jgi:hypothetical protein
MSQKRMLVMDGKRRADEWYCGCTSEWPSTTTRVFGKTDESALMK